VKWGYPDDRVLPQSASAHAGGDELRTSFAASTDTAVTVVIPDANGLPPDDLDRYAAELAKVPDSADIALEVVPMKPISAAAYPQL
jgi:RND superfamily putative drug exporter